MKTKAVLGRASSSSFSSPSSSPSSSSDTIRSTALLTKFSSILNWVLMISCLTSLLLMRCVLLYETTIMSPSPNVGYVPWIATSAIPSSSSSSSSSSTSSSSSLALPTPATNSKVAIVAADKKSLKKLNTRVIPTAKTAVSSPPPPSSSSSTSAATPIRTTNQTLQFSNEYTSQTEQNDRKYRFPSVEDRVMFYMGGWYLPPCPGNTQIQLRFRKIQTNHTGSSSGKSTTTSSSHYYYYVQELPHGHNQAKKRDALLIRPAIAHVRIFAVGEAEMKACGKGPYCLDTSRYLLPAIQKVDPNFTIPVLIQYGDAYRTRAHTSLVDNGKTITNIHAPVFRKYRLAFEGGFTMIEKLNERQNDKIHHRDPKLPDGASSCVADPVRPIPPTVEGQFHHPEGIITRMKSSRHYKMVPAVAGHDRKWSEKKNMAVFRGSFTGINRGDGSESILRDKNIKFTHEELCLRFSRCRLVLQTAQSKFVDAKITIFGTTIIPETIGNVSLRGKPLSYSSMLEYKALIMLEGNDVSTGLKWALYSQSVVMMPKPTRSSWAMEELLEPWVHYIPLKDDLTDVTEKVQWMIAHDSEAEEIAKRASLWMKDLVLHPDSQHDDELINEEMIRRYGAHFLWDDTLVLADDIPANTPAANQTSITAKKTRVAATKRRTARKPATTKTQAAAKPSAPTKPVAIRRKVAATNTIPANATVATAEPTTRSVGASTAIAITKTASTNTTNRVSVAATKMKRERKKRKVV